jgi:hypothetical protein
MSTISLKIKIEGKSQLHLPSVVLEKLYPINLFSFDGGVTWRNDDVTVPLDGNLDVLVSCRAITGTKWTFTVTNKETGKDIINTSGKTGDPIAHQANERIENFSEKRFSLSSDQIA